MSGAFKFAAYTLRPVEAADREQRAAWVAADPHHRDTVKPEFFDMVLEDENGAAYFVHFEPTWRVHIQFGPMGTKAERERTMKALQYGMGWLRGFCGHRGIQQLIFSSKFPPLIRFCVKRLGFRESASELLCATTPNTAPQGAGRPAADERTSGEEVLTAAGNHSAQPANALTSEGNHVRS